MAETANPVRKVHYHLRRAGALLATQQFDEALTAVDAALAIDPASLAAQAMRERIIAAAGRSTTITEVQTITEDQTHSYITESSTSAAVAMEPPPFVPTGVDAQVWLGFEQRIQERRFRALLAQIEKALASKDGIAARVALEEARELRPASAELADLADRVTLLPIRIPASDDAAHLGPRALNAVALLAVGVMALMGLEWVRPARQVPIASAQIAASPSPVVPSVAATTPVTEHEQPAPAPAPATTQIDTAPPAIAEREIPEPVPTSGVRHAVSIERPVDGGPAPATFRAVVPTIEPRVPAKDGEVSDNYIAPESRRASESNADPVQTSAFTPRQAAAPVTPPVATPVQVPEATVAVASLPKPDLPARAAVAPGTAVATTSAARGDETRVTQVLNQYARAYEKLDASAARAVWPTVDERALARAFASLQSQDVSFDACDVDVRGTTAIASCRGKASYIGKVGNREPRTEQRQWTFELRRDNDDAWKIQTAQAQRVAYQR